ncbi:MAG TPA: ATP-binding cassette domain-containing protein, partial [Ilumatobacteraceae bacterium]|nr:ATP-binding cassette domain-containing protein [Ilumatobacteraceae bacterium]
MSTTHTLEIRGLVASVAGNRILEGIDLTVRSGEVHAVMGPNGSGKSTLAHALMGRGDYEVTTGSVTIDGDELLGRPTWQRAQAGLFLAMQYPVEVPGVPLASVVSAARGGNDLSAAVAREAQMLGVPTALLE